MDIFVSPWRCIQVRRGGGETLQHLEEVFSFLVLILAASSVSEWTLHLRELLLSPTIDFTCKRSRMLQEQRGPV